MIHGRLWALALLVPFSTPALAEGESTAEKIRCKMDFNMKGWAAIVRSAEGSGTITCSNGEKIDVMLGTMGIGLAAGRAEFTDAHGVFSPVERTEDLLGTYVGQTAVAAAGKADAAAAFTKGDVSLAVSAQGEGSGLVSGGGEPTIKRKQPQDGSAKK